METNKKSLEDLLSRNDYKRLTVTLKERVEDVAKRIRTKMEELDIPNDDDFYKGEIGVDNVVVSIKRVHSNSGYSYDFLAIKRIEEDPYFDVSYSWHSLEDINHDYYYCNDFNARVHGATNKEALAFVNVAGRIIEGLAEIEEEKVAAVEEALSKIVNI